MLQPGFCTLASCRGVAHRTCLEEAEGETLGQLGEQHVLLSLCGVQAEGAAALVLRVQDGQLQPLQERHQPQPDSCRWQQRLVGKLQ